MVKHSATGSQRSSVSKTTGGSQISGLKDLSLLDEPGLWKEGTPGDPPELPTPGEAHCGFPDSVYVLAAAIFQNSHLEKPAAHRLISYGKRAGLQLAEAKDEASQRSAYELAFNTLKYQELLEGIMIDSCFHLSQPMPEDQMSLVAVMLYDFQDRKFLPRGPGQGEEHVWEVEEVESCLLRFKIKLAASLARCRIRQDLRTIDLILPESVRKKQERASNLPLFAWVNTLKSSLHEVSGVLKRGGFSQVNSIGQLEGQTFCQDPHCEDTLVFPPQLKADLYRTKLLSEYKLIIQDKSCSVGPCVVRPLLVAEGDVLMAGCSSAFTVAHTASLVAHGHVHGQSKVFVCVSDRQPAQREKLQEALANMACKNVKLIPESFLSLESGDQRLQRVRVILLTPQCSLSAISNPVELILQENRDTDLLQDLSRGSIAQSKLDALVAQQKKNIDHALKFSKVQAVVYVTCSSCPEENEGVVGRALEQAGGPTNGSKLQPFRLSSSLPVSLGPAEGAQSDGAFFRLEPSEQSNGCFLAVLSREPDPEEVESVQDVLARADATGLLDRLGTNKPIRKERRSRPARTQTLTGQARAAQTRPHGTVSSQAQVTAFLNRQTQGSSSAPTVARQGLANGVLSPQGKAKPIRRRPPKPVIPSNSTSGPSLYSAPNPIVSPSRKRVIRLFNTAAFVKDRRSPAPTSHHHPAPPPTAPAPPLVPPGLNPGLPKGRQEVLRLVALTLPPVLFPRFSPPARQMPPPPTLTQKSNSMSGFYHWKGQPLTRSTGSVNKEARAVHPRPWL